MFIYYHSESPFNSRDGSGLKIVTKTISEALKFQDF